MRVGKHGYKSFNEFAENLHDWSPSASEAKEIQTRLRKRLIFEDKIGKVNMMAGADVGFNRDQSVMKAGVTIHQVPDLNVVEEATATMSTSYPYIPGLLSFREAPVLLKALDKLRLLPDVILCDSQGYAHPRRFGLACHLGILTEIPTLGVAKSKLIGEYQPLPEEKGASVPLMDDDEQVGLVLRSRTNVKPLFVSVGHKTSLAKAKSVVMQALTRYRLPETTRKADALASSK